MPLVLDGTLGASAVQDNSVTDTALSLTANSAAIKVALNANNGAPIFACRAWVNFNGTGTVAIRASGNVSSITDNGTGDYTVNFTTAMPDGFFSTSALVSTDNIAQSFVSLQGNAGAQTTTSVRFFVSNATTSVDRALICATIFR